MKVALLGAQGSGKTDVGTRIVRALNRDQPNGWKLIDGYVDELAKKTGRRYGFEGDTPHNIQVMAARWTKEAEALHRGLSTVTCGTIYETMLYEAFRWLNPPVGDEQAYMTYMDEGSTTMKFFTMMDEQTFNYDLLFFVGTVEPHNHTWPGALNFKLPEILEGRFRYAAPLTGPPTEKARHALRIIRHIRDLTDAAEAEAAPDDGPAV